MKNLGKRLEQKFYKNRICKQPINVCINTSMRYRYKLTRIAKIKIGKDVKQWELPNNAGGSVNWKIIFII